MIDRASLSLRRWLVALLTALTACNGAGDLLLGRDSITAAGASGSSGSTGGGQAGAGANGGQSGATSSGGQPGAGAGGAGAGQAGAAGSAGGNVGTFWTGVNLSGAENENTATPVEDKLGINYFYPTAKQFAYYQGKGLTTIRLPFHWKRLQHELMADLDPTELAQIDKVVGLASERGMRLLLDPHNKDGLYDGHTVGSAEVPPEAFADLWSRLATRYLDQPLVVFDLLDGPRGVSPVPWLAAANAAIAAIRKTGATQLILVPGVIDGGAAGWFTPVAGASNAETMLGVVDPGHNLAFEVHQFLDPENSGQNACPSATVGSERLAPFTTWLRQHGQRGFLGEIGARYDDATCLAALDDALMHLDANRDVWMGWTYWAGGPVFGIPISVEPSKTGEDRPQMAILVKHVDG